MKLDMTKVLGLDFETYSDVNLTVHGLPRYVASPHFQPLVGAVHHATTGSDALDFIQNPGASIDLLRDCVSHYEWIAAHNAPFEHAVLRWMNIDVETHRFIDTSVLARAMGASGRLEAAAPQLLNGQKMASGARLIRLFTMPSKQQLASGDLAFDSNLPVQHAAEWNEFKNVYCVHDSRLGLQLAQHCMDLLTVRERNFMETTFDMNLRGWPVDLAMVEEMQRRYKDNQVAALQEFRDRWNEPDLNLNSFPQMKKWCSDRGVKATSFDEKAVEKYRAALGKKLATQLAPGVRESYLAVDDVLRTKQILGGSSLKKLQVILNTVIEDPVSPDRGRLYDQYLHIGAGQTWRTTGRSTQMQNLKRLDADDIGDMDSLLQPDTDWDNTKLALNIRQVFTSAHPKGVLLVGDLKSVESRGLAWLAGAHWKVKGYKKDLDMYKVLASRILGVDYHKVTSSQRQLGKVGELSCGYGAGGLAVKDFAAKMGTLLEEGEANQLVADWRRTNPEIVAFWNALDEGLHKVIERQSLWTYTLPDALELRLFPVSTPSTLALQHRGATSIKLQLVQNGRHSREPIMQRFFHGCYLRGRDICYYKPSSRKTGELWSGHYTHPKTKHLVWHKIYGAKLAGILTQSLCRELFMDGLAQVNHWTQTCSNVELIGQFHDEIVVDVHPPTAAHEITVAAASMRLEESMTLSLWAGSFPLAADIKQAYRYIK
jgi:DNA polymerase